MKTPDASDAASPALAGLVDKVIERLQRGESVDWHALERAHPADAEELRRLRPALQLLDSARGVAAEPSGDAAAARPRLADAPAKLGDYQLLREAGRGGMGVVYEALQLSLNRRVALKVLPLAAMLDSRQLARFKAEARAAAQMHHTNIVPVFSVGYECGVHYYAMQYIEGCTLAHIVERLRAAQGEPAGREATTAHGGPTAADDLGRRAYTGASAGAPRAAPADAGRDTESRAASTAIEQRSRHPAAYYRTVARWGIQAAEALQYAHQRGVVHRDVKPANLILDESGNVWVADFGLARLEADVGLTMTGDLVGTLRYMSPEQAGVGPVRADRRSDIYSLGMTLYELAGLRCAFESRERSRILRQIIDEEPRSLRRTHRSIPAELDVIILKCIAKAPAERYADAQQLADDLRRFLDHRPIAARPSTRRQRGVKWLRRHRSLAATVAAAVVFATAVLGVNLWWTRARAWERRQAAATARERQAAEKLRHLQKLEYALDLRSLDESRMLSDGHRPETVLSKHHPRTGRPHTAGFEWRYYWALENALRRSLLKTMPAHRRQTYCAAFSHDGRLAVTGSEDATAKIWAYPAMSLQRTLVGHLSDVNWGAFSPDDKRLATCSDDGTARIWEVATGRQLKSFVTNLPWAADGGQTIAYGIAYSCDGKTLMTAHKRETKLWDADTGGQLGTLPGRGLAMSEHRRVVATTPADGTVTIWNLDTQKPLGTFSDSGHRSQFNTAVFSRDDAALVVAGEDGFLYRFDLRWQGEEVVKTNSPRWFVSEAAIEVISSSRNGSRAAVACKNGLVEVWDFAAIKRIGGPYRHSTRAFTAATSPDDQTVLSVGLDGNLMQWSATCDQPRQQVFATPAFTGFSGQFLPGGDAFAAFTSRVKYRTEGDALQLLSVVEGTWPEVNRFTTRGAVRSPAHDTSSGMFVEGMAVSPTGAVAVAGRGGIFLWNGDLGEPCLRCLRAAESDEAESIPVVAGTAGRIVFVGAGALAVIVDGGVQLFDLEGRTLGRQFASPSAEEQHQSLAASSDGRYLAIGGEAGSFWVYDATSQRAVAGGRAASQGIARMAFLAPHPWLALGSDDGTIAIWDLAANRLRSQLAGHLGAVNALAWHARDERLASSGLLERGIVRLWDVEVDQQVASLSTEPSHAVYDLAFSPKGDSLAACVVDWQRVGRILRWKAPLVRSAAE